MTRDKRDVQCLAWQHRLLAVLAHLFMLCLGVLSAGGAFAQTATTTTLTSPANPGYTGYIIRLGATVSGSSPTGSVTFKDGSTTLGSATIASGAAAYNATFTTTGAHSLTAVYSGDAANAASTSAVLTQTINTTAAVWAFVAAENVSFTVSGTQIVRFGSGTHWVQKSLSGAVLNGACDPKNPPDSMGNRPPVGRSIH